MRPSFHDPDLEACFVERGYAVVDLLDDGAVAALTAVFARFADRHWDGISPTILNLDRQYRQTVHTEVHDVLQPALDAHLAGFRLVHGGFVPKSAASPVSAMDLHQDHSWVDEPEHQGITVWSPLVDTDERNGWLGVVEGSHRFGPHLRPPLPFAWPHLAELVYERHVSYLPMRAGQALLMHPAAFHTSPPNGSAATRLVAAGMAAPLEAPLLYCHTDFGGDEERVDVYDVDDGFYQRHRMGTRPGGRPARSLARELPPLGPEDLQGLVPSRA